MQVDGVLHEPGPGGRGSVLLLSSLPYEPEYGDVVVIDSYTDYGKLLIKRVIGKEGDVIDIDFDSGIVYRNGQALEEPYTAAPTYLYEGGQFSHHRAGGDALHHGRQPQRLQGTAARPRSAASPRGTCWARRCSA